MDMFTDFFRRWGVSVVLLGLIVGGAAAYGIYSQLPVTYKAVAMLQFQPPQEGEFDRFKSTQMSMITSRNVLRRALDNQEARTLPIANSEDPEAALAKLITFESDPLSQNVAVVIVSQNPKEAQILVNSVFDAYIEEAKTQKNAGFETQEQIARTRLSEHESEILKLQSRMLDVAREAKYPDPDSVRIGLQDKMKEEDENRKARSDLELQLAQANSELEVLKKLPIRLTPEQAELVESEDMETRKERDALAILEEQAETIRAESIQGDRDPEYQKRINFIRERRNRINERKQGRIERFEANLKEQRDAKVAVMESNVAVLETQLKRLDRDKLRLNNEVNRLQDAAREISELKRKLDDEQKLQSETRKTLEDVRSQSLSRHITPVHKATEPRLPDRSPRRYALTAGAGLAGFGLVALIFLFFDFRLKLVSRPEQLQRGLNMPVLGILPTLPKGQRLPTDADFAEKSRHRRRWLAMQEAVNSLRITLTFAPDRHDEGLSSLMITSARDGEGKSTLAANLAVSLARSGVRVIVVEADMHRPTQYVTFETDRTPGLTDVLQGTVDIAEAIQETRYPNLYILAAGTPFNDLSALLIPERLASVFAYLRKSFQTVLVDAPPVLPVSDTLLLGRQVDQTVIAAMCNHSQMFKVAQAVNRLESVGVSIIGTVVAGNAASATSDYYSYGYGYGYGATGRSPAVFTPDDNSRRRESASNQQVAEPAKQKRRGK